jgi:hypothetical protein
VSEDGEFEAGWVDARTLLVGVSEPAELRTIDASTGRQAVVYRADDSVGAVMINRIVSSPEGFALFSVSPESAEGSKLYLFDSDSRAVTYIGSLSSGRDWDYSPALGTLLEPGGGYGGLVQRRLQLPD